LNSNALVALATRSRQENAYYARIFETGGDWEKQIGAMSAHFRNLATGKTVWTTVALWMRRDKSRMAAQKGNFQELS
jgi:hypothetical protein